MGLAAGQARLLSITSRKSDCEFQSMRLSHQKIALSRELADLSNEYQNSLDQTKLVYDYYGTGDTNTPLTYDILMNPSALNDYMPVTITDTSGRVTLNSEYAAAARAAGIPQEGLGTLPSETTRNAFINGLANAGLITEKTANSILNIPYNQNAGIGGNTTVTDVLESGNINDLLEQIKNTCTGSFDFDGIPSYNNVENGIQFDLIINNSVNSSGSGLGDLTLYSLLNGSAPNYAIGMQSVDGQRVPDTQVGACGSLLTSTGGFVDFLMEEFSSVLDLGDGATGDALAYAKNELTKLLTNGNFYARSTEIAAFDDSDTCKTHTVENNQNYIGFSYTFLEWSRKMDKRNSYGAISLNNLAKAFLTYFADYMNGVDKVNSNGKDIYSVQKGHLGASSLVTNDYLYNYTWKIDTSISSSDDLSQSVFYDTLFNQICANGWTENNNIEDKDYLQQMLQSGMLYISKIKDDGYYYQVNYGTDSYIKEVADETYIAQAEAKYNTEKARLNSKEETIDLKMKNLDTEISSLTTEYDTVKNTISKNIEKSFKRYNA